MVSSGGNIIDEIVGGGPSLVSFEDIFTNQWVEKNKLTFGISSLVPRKQTCGFSLVQLADVKDKDNEKVCSNSLGQKFGQIPKSSRLNLAQNPLTRNDVKKAVRKMNDLGSWFVAGIPIKLTKSLNNNTSQYCTGFKVMNLKRGLRVLNVLERNLKLTSASDSFVLSVPMMS